MSKEITALRWAIWTMQRCFICAPADCRERKLTSRPGRMVTGVTILGIVLFTLLPVTPVGKMLGMTAMPPVYFLFLVIDVIAYLLLVTLAKAFYIKKNQDLI